MDVTLVSDDESETQAPPIITKTANEFLGQSDGKSVGLSTIHSVPGHDNIMPRAANHPSTHDQMNNLIPPPYDANVAAGMNAIIDDDDGYRSNYFQNEDEQQRCSETILNFLKEAEDDESFFSQNQDERNILDMTMSDITTRDRNPTIRQASKENTGKYLKLANQ